MESSALIRRLREAAVGPAVGQAPAGTPVIAAVDSEPGGTLGPAASPAGFEVHLDVFEGPFDLSSG